MQVSLSPDTPSYTVWPKLYKNTVTGTILLNSSSWSALMSIYLLLLFPSNTNTFALRELYLWWWSAAPLKHFTPSGTSLLCISFWVSELDLQMKHNTELLYLHRHTFTYSVFVSKFYICVFPLICHAKLLEDTKIFLFLLFTGYIPKAWFCKTLNLYLNRSV